MKELTASKKTISFGISLVICSFANAVLDIVKESNKKVMAGMARMTGHHWITHSAAIVILFFGLGWGLAKFGEARPVTNKFIGWLTSGVLAGCLMIAGFYLLAD